MMPNTEKNQNIQVSEEQAPSVVPAEAMQYIDNWGLIGIMVIIALEMATPIGILFPTDAIVFWWGMYFSAKGTIPGWIWTIMILFSVAVIAGDVMWFWRGKLLAPKIQTMQDKRYFKRKWITMCEQYFEEYGNKTMLISKFLPIRSMVPIVAGVIQKPTIPYILQSALSAVLWVGSLLGVSYFIIWLIPEAANHIGLLTFLFVVLPQIGSIWYALLPMYRKYEKKLAGATENLQKISTEFKNIGQQLGTIGGEFAAIGGEVKNIVTKLLEKDESESVPSSGESVVPLSKIENNPVVWIFPVQNSVQQTVPLVNVDVQKPIEIAPVIQESIPQVVPTPIQEDNNVTPPPVV